MRSSATLVRNLSFTFKHIQERLTQLWNIDYSRDVRNWVAKRLKKADTSIKMVRLAYPRAFWSVVVAMVPVTMAPSSWLTRGHLCRGIRVSSPVG
jgi:hypothetical protein